ncbi:MAG: 3-dehydroquinate synthase [Pseudomonadota bacterium]
MTDSNAPPRTLSVELGQRGYPIHIGRGLLDDPDLIRSKLGKGRVMVVTDTEVAPHYLGRLLAQFDDPAYVVLPAGEEHKKPEGLTPIYDALVATGCGRDATLVVLGGGVIGDMGGFAAASFQRGINFIQVPTTLLAQVDSSVGGKTGVNHPGGKNLIGAFHQPQCVVCDTATLDTLDERNLRAGLAEVIKYGLIEDTAFLDWLEENLPLLLERDTDALVHAIARSCEIKAQVVADDERESTGRRAVLNLGHTFGHAIETLTGHRDWLHGEAVATGMVMAADMSRRMGWLSQDDCDRVRCIVRSAGLPVTPPPADSAEFLKLMARDKKVAAGRIRLVLLRALGNATLEADYDDKHLHATLDAALD